MPNDPNSWAICLKGICNGLLRHIVWLCSRCASVAIVGADYTHTAPCNILVWRCDLLAVQIDLTDDYVVMALFGDGVWEDTMQRLTAKDEDGKLVDVKLDQEAFRDIISVLE